MVPYIKVAAEMFSSNCKRLGYVIQEIYFCHTSDWAMTWLHNMATTVFLHIDYDNKRTSCTGCTSHAVLLGLETASSMVGSNPTEHEHMVLIVV